MILFYIWFWKWKWKFTYFAFLFWFEFSCQFLLRMVARSWCASLLYTDLNQFLESFLFSKYSIVIIKKKKHKLWICKYFVLKLIELKFLFHTQILIVIKRKLTTISRRWIFSRFEIIFLMNKRRNYRVYSKSIKLQRRHSKTMQFFDCTLDSRIVICERHDLTSLHTMKYWRYTMHPFN